jgi:hypothetical protein
MLASGSIHWYREASISRLLKVLLVGFALALGTLDAQAQCSGQPASGRLCGNNTGSATLPGWQTMSSMLDRNFGAPSTQGQILNRGASLWSATAAPSLGLNGGTGGAITLNGATSGAVTLGVKAAAGTSVTFNLPTTNGSANQVLITDGSGNTSWTTAGAGTVSSVGLALPSSILTVSGSPVTGTGTLTGTLATQSANLVWAGPTTGSAATPTFRSLVGADLPNPSASTLGGVQSIVAVSHEWISTISTSGVPALSQPAFTDISGTLAAAQCPNPSATTIGCVESYVAVSHQWINTISTAGVPSSTQPNFTDLAGSATLAQLPSISNNSILGNNSGGTSVPSSLSASNVLDIIGSTQGDILYRGSAGWAVLAPGTNGYVLTTGGAAANPSWVNPSSGGTVTSVATNNGVTGGTFTTSGTIGLATITSGSVLANITGGSAVPIANTPSSILDLIGSSTGDILYRSSGSGWQVLAPGTNGQVLTQGSSTPSWSNVGTLTNVTIAAGTGIGVTGTCSISTTGTCTVGLSTPVSSTNGGSGVSSPTAHTVQVGEGSSAFAGVGPGTIGQTLTSNGASADPSYQSGSWTLLATLTASNSASLSDQTACGGVNCITSAYNEYLIVLENIVPATTSNSCAFQLHSNGSFQSTGYLANSLRFQGATVAGAAATTFIPCDSDSGSLVNSGTGVSGEWTIYKPSQTSTPKSVIGQYNEGVSGGAIAGMAGGVWNGGNTAVDGIQLLMNSGNITSGTMKIYGRL